MGKEECVWPKGREGRQRNTERAREAGWVRKAKEESDAKTKKRERLFSFPWRGRETLFLFFSRGRDSLLSLERERERLFLGRDEERERERETTWTINVLCPKSYIIARAPETDAGPSDALLGIRFLRMGGLVHLLKAFCFPLVSKSTKEEKASSAQDWGEEHTRRLPPSTVSFRHLYWGLRSGVPQQYNPAPRSLLDRNETATLGKRHVLALIQGHTTEVVHQMSRSFGWFLLRCRLGRVLRGKRGIARGCRFRHGNIPNVLGSRLDVLGHLLRAANSFPAPSLRFGSCTEHRSFHHLDLRIRCRFAFLGIRKRRRWFATEHLELRHLREVGSIDGFAAIETSQK